VSHGRVQIILRPHVGAVPSLHGKRRADPGREDKSQSRFVPTRRNQL
jgi:hypothetical protein